MPIHDTFYARVGALGLKRTSVPTVWQTLDEQHHFNVPDPSTKDAEELEAYLHNLEAMVQGING